MCGPTCVFAFYVGHAWERFKDAPWRVVRPGRTVADLDRPDRGERFRGGIGAPAHNCVAVAVIAATTAIVTYTTRLNPLWIFAAAALLGSASAGCDLKFVALASRRPPECATERECQGGGSFPAQSWVRGELSCPRASIVPEAARLRVRSNGSISRGGLIDHRVGGRAVRGARSMCRSPTVPRIIAHRAGSLVGVAVTAGILPVRAPQDFYGGLVLVMLATLALDRFGRAARPARLCLRSRNRAAAFRRSAGRARRRGGD